MEKYKVIVTKKGEKTIFLENLSKERAMDETTRYVDMVLKNSNHVSYISKSKAQRNMSATWENWFTGDGYYKLHDTSPTMILSELEMGLGISKFSHDALIDVYIEKE